MNHTTNASRPEGIPPQALTIAGSDSCGGAGIQADIKTMTLFGVQAATVLTAVTAQNTAGVHAVRGLDSQFVADQLDAVMDDLTVGAIKTGMLASAQLIETIADRLPDGKHPPLVLDPVMVATSGARLLESSAEKALIERLLPKACLITPNLPEAAVLTGLSEESPAEAMAERLLKAGCQAVLIKGGHRRDEQVVDQLFSGDGIIEFVHPRVAGELHGTGCSLSAAIAAGLAKGDSLAGATSTAIEWLHQRIQGRWLTRHGQIAMLDLAGR